MSVELNFHLVGFGIPLLVSLYALRRWREARPVVPILLGVGGTIACILATAEANCEYLQWRGWPTVFVLASSAWLAFRHSRLLPLPLFFGLCFVANLIPDLYLGAKQAALCRLPATVGGAGWMDGLLFNPAASTLLHALVCIVALGAIGELGGSKFKSSLIRLVQFSPPPNSSFKPKPLRGSA